MLYYTASQPLEFIALMLAGMAMAAVSLLFSLARRLICAGRWLSLASDMLMGVVWAVIVCLSLTLACRGRFRLYHLAAIMAGAALFHAAMAVPLSRICSCLHRCASRLLTCLRQNRVLRVIFK